MSGTTTLYAHRAILPAARPGGPLRVEPALVVIDQGRITAVDEAPDTVPPTADDLGPEFLLAPAFIDAHTHLALHGLRGAASTAAATGNLVEDLFFRVEEAMEPEDIKALSRVGALEALMSGTAVVHDHYYAADAVLDALQEVGLAGIVAPALQDLAGPGQDGWQEALDLTERLDDTPSLATTGHGVMIGPHATDTVSDLLWRRIADLAEARDLPVHVHVAQSIDEQARADALGTTPLGRLAATGALDAGPAWLLVHGLFVEPQELDGLDRSRHTLVACPRSWSRFGIPADVAAWRASGLPVAVGSDAAASNDATCVQAELAALDALWPAGALGVLEGAGRRARGLRRADALWNARTARHAARPSASDLFRSATEVPGAIHPRLSSGRITEGHLAHLAVWDASHPTLWPADDLVAGLVFGRPQGALAQLMVAGVWRGPRGTIAFADHLLNAPDTRRWLEEAHARRTALLSRCGVR